MVAAGLDGNITAVLSEESNGASSRTSTTSSVNFPSAHFQDIYTVSDNSFHTNSRGIPGKRQLLRDHIRFLNA